MHRAPFFAVAALALAILAPSGPSQAKDLGKPMECKKGFYENPWGSCVPLEIACEDGRGGIKCMDWYLFLYKWIGSPLVLDLNNDGKIGVTNLADDPESFFDIDEDGLAEQIAWVGPDDGLLARDLNGNGRIDDASELFGSIDEDGFTQLARLDSNDDGIVDRADPNFTSLLIWRDDNGDGISMPEELHPLSAFSISAIHIEASLVNEVNAGNRVSHIGTFVVNENGRAESRAVHDVWFRYSNMNSRFSGEFDLDDRASSLPDLRGYGAIPNLRIAMSLDQDGAANLLDQVDQLAAIRFEKVFEKDGQAAEVVRDILFTWAGVNDMAPDGRGPFVDGRELAFLEKLTDQIYLQRGIHPNPFGRAGNKLGNLFEYVYDLYHARLLSQVIGEEIFRFEEGYALHPGSTPGLKSAYDLESDEFEGIVGLKPAGIRALEIIAGAASDPDHVWEIALRVIEFSVGLDALPAEDLALLSHSLEASGASPLAAYTLALQAVRQRLQDTVQRQERRKKLTDIDEDGYLAGTVENDLLVGDNDDEIMEGREGDDEIRGNGGNDILNGQKGSDYLLGGAGDDTYVFELGSGIDVINEGNDSKGRDILSFGAGIALSDLIFERRGNRDLMISLRDNPLDAVLIENQFNSKSRLEILRFADGSEDSLVTRRYSLNGTERADKLIGITIGGSPDDVIWGLGGNDTINGKSGNDWLDGGDGDDQILGGDGADVLIGGPGNDILKGGRGNDVLEGGAGNDSLSGGPGDDTFRYESGDDVFRDSSGRLDRILAETIRSDDASYLRVGNDLKIVLRDGGSLLLSRHFARSRRIESITYSDTVVDLSSIVYTNQGGPGNDRLRGGDGDDTLIGGSGDDILWSGAGNDSLDGGHGDDRLDGGKGDDVLEPGHGDDVVKGGAGNDRFIYLSGHDRYADRAGDHDVVIISRSYKPEQVELLRRIDGLGGLRLEINDANSVFLEGQFTSRDAFEEIFFEATGDRIDLKTLQPTTMGSENDDVLYGVKKGANTDDRIYGLAGNDWIKGGRGDDWLAGGPGNDRLEGGVGSDTYFYAIGDGKDIIIDTGGLDVILFGEGIESEDIVLIKGARALTIELPSHQNGRLILIDQGKADTRQIERIEFSDGSTLDLVSPE